MWLNLYTLFFNNSSLFSPTFNHTLQCQFATFGAGGEETSVAGFGQLHGRLAEHYSAGSLNILPGEASS